MNDQKTEILSLTAVRGLAAWFVVFFHFKTFLAAYLPPEVIGLFASGYLAVDLFFVLSGFVIFLNHAHLNPRAGREMKNFYLKRFARIYPLHIFMLGAYVALVTVVVTLHHGLPAQRFSLASLVADVALLQDWSPSTALTWNDPAWSISAEAAAYLTFPLIVIGCRRLLGRILPIAGFAIAFVLMNTIFSLQHFELGANIGSVGIIRCIGEFSLGAITARMYQEWRRPTVAASVFLLFLSALFAYFSRSLGTSLTFPIIWSIVIYVLAVYTPTSPGLPIRALVFLGKISYATYMCHYLIYDIFKLVAVNHKMETSEIALILAFFAILVVSVMLHFQVEQPIYRYLVKQPKKTAPATALGHA